MAKYRADIDGLRALAIVPVVLFHLDVAGFRGGFVGVDVFFVISGYLITSIIHREMQVGRFSFLRFYERRIRRLYPALITVLATSLVVAGVLLLPADLALFGRTLAASAVFLANWHFSQATGYFDAPAEQSPLLHLWSLAVEEQFYLFFPVLLLILHRHLPTRLGVVLVGLSAMSLALSMVAEGSSDSFYLPMFRVWELFIGALLALDVVPRVTSQRLLELLGVTGLAMIAFAVAVFSGETRFPGYAALVPTIGTAFLIYAGVSTSAARFLSLRALVFLGLISYPLYLWHWPAIVFTKYYLLRPLAIADKTLIALASVGLAALTWRYIERPIRENREFWRANRVFGVAGASTALVIGLGLLGQYTGGLPQRLPADVVNMAASELPESECYDAPAASLARGGCHVGVPAEPEFLVWGDSHALAMLPAVDAAARGRAVAGVFIGKSGCPPLLGVTRYDLPFGGCREFNESVIAFLEERPELRQVVLVGRWALNNVGTRYGEEFGSPAVLSDEGIAGNAAVFKEGLSRTVDTLTAMGRSVVFVTQVPEIGWEVPSVLARSTLYGRPAPSGPTTEEYQRRQHGVLEALRYAAPLSVVDVSLVLCPGETCITEVEGKPIYADNNHLSQSGALELSGVLSSVFNP